MLALILRDFLRRVDSLSSSMNLTALDETTTVSIRTKGETFISPNQTNRLSAGAALWEILCPPAGCVGCYAQSGRNLQVWGSGRSFFGDSRATQPRQAPAARSAKVEFDLCHTRLGYPGDCASAYCSGLTPANPGCPRHAVAARKTVAQS